MDKIQIFLDKQDKIIAEDKEKTLLSLGLTEREYAPDGHRSRVYDKLGYLNGKEVYYREVAIQVTDEEWAAILEKTRQVEAIREREELIREREEKRRTRGMAKKWLPIFEKPVEPAEDGGAAPKAPDTGKSRIATGLRIVAWVMGIALQIFGFILSIGAGEPIQLIFTLIGGVLELLLFYAIAEALDYLCEMTAILRHGFHSRDAGK